MRKSLLVLTIIALSSNTYGGDRSSSRLETAQTAPAPGIVYRNPRVYNVDYSFEMFPDPNRIDRAKDLKVWIPIPREWDSQKAVKIISVQPEPHARYADPEYGNPMLFWDFGKMPEQTTYQVNIKFRLESYEVSVKVDPNRVGSYDKTTQDYALYTRSTHTISITPKIRELAREAIGDETNPYLQAKRIIEFTKKKVRFKLTAFERGRGINCLLDNPVINEKTGEEYYEGACNQYCALFVALCRAVGIPARCVSGYIGWNPWIDPNDVKARYPFETKLSPEGLAATQFYGELDSHMWGEFFIPNYGWIPTDPTSGKIGYQSNRGWIKYKGRDIQLGPHAPQQDSEGYGVNWVALHKGRADSLCYGALNIAKIRNSKVALLHLSDPFPADELAGYGQNPYTFHTWGIDKDLRHWRQEVLSIPYLFGPNPLNLEQFYSKIPYGREPIDAFTCDMLRRQLGEEKFFRLVDTYVALRQKFNQPVSTSHFQKLAEDIYGEPLGWFFKQWINSTERPRLKLEKVAVRKDKEGWLVHGRLVQSGDTIFRLPIELAIDTKNGREKQKLWVEAKATDFDFYMLNEPQSLVVDPDYEVLKIQKMPSRFLWFRNAYHNYIVIYGTLAEAKANKTAAESFSSDYLGLGSEIMKADTDVNEVDLKTKCVFLIGRPKTNKVAQQFKDSFPIKFDGAKFTWQGITYNKPTQGVAQVIDNTQDGGWLMIMYAGLSPEATLKVCDLELYDADCSYVIFEGDKQTNKGDWEDVDSNLYWNFGARSSVQSGSNQ